MLPNPTSFSVNEVIFSITSVDVLFHLTNQQLFLNGQDPIRLDENGLEIPIEIDSTAKDQIARGCRHLLRQRSWVFWVTTNGPGTDQEYWFFLDFIQYFQLHKFLEIPSI